MACKLVAAEAKECKRAGSGGGIGVGTSGAAEDVQSDWDQRKLDSWWNAYIGVNRKFREVVADLVEGRDVVWVHNYYLALLPRMLRVARGETKVVGAAGVGKHKMLGNEMMVGKGGGC